MISFNLSAQTFIFSENMWLCVIKVLKGSKLAMKSCHSFNLCLQHECKHPEHIQLCQYLWCSLMHSEKSDNLGPCADVRFSSRHVCCCVYLERRSSKIQRRRRRRKKHPSESMFVFILSWRAKQLFLHKNYTVYSTFKMHLLWSATSGIKGVSFPGHQILTLVGRPGW